LPQHTAPALPFLVAWFRLILYPKTNNHSFECLQESLTNPSFLIYPRETRQGQCRTILIVRQGLPASGMS
jgi:hypothetical protein